MASTPLLSPSTTTVAPNRTSSSLTHQLFHLTSMVPFHTFPAKNHRLITKLKRVLPRQQTCHLPHFEKTH
ncbi:hypothetical protein OIU74_018031 [Salix koriyanagi]|uniref:Uncharacterized protein n=1 Tax=Salix koriyanagi TaxID=2511006 RepID=A0A9Q1AHK1_9ROSI|nr:hypothetical protein OIU74_018031 [Salix koriyanagi]